MLTVDLVHNIITTLDKQGKNQSRTNFGGSYEAIYALDEPDHFLKHLIRNQNDVSIGTLIYIHPDASKPEATWEIPLLEFCMTSDEVRVFDTPDDYEEQRRRGELITVLLNMANATSPANHAQHKAENEGGTFCPQKAEIQEREPLKTFKNLINLLNRQYDPRGQEEERYRTGWKNNKELYVNCFDEISVYIEGADCRVRLIQTIDKDFNITCEIEIRDNQPDSVTWFTVTAKNPATDVNCSVIFGPDLGSQPATREDNIRILNRLHKILQGKDRAFTPHPDPAP